MLWVHCYWPLPAQTGLPAVSSNEFDGSFRPSVRRSGARRHRAWAITHQRTQTGATGPLRAAFLNRDASEKQGQAGVRPRCRVDNRMSASFQRIATDPWNRTKRSGLTRLFENLAAQGHRRSPGHGRWARNHSRYGGVTDHGRLVRHRALRRPRGKLPEPLGKECAWAVDLIWPGSAGAFHLLIKGVTQQRAGPKIHLKVAVAQRYAELPNNVLSGPGLREPHEVTGHPAGDVADLAWMLTGRRPGFGGFPSRGDALRLPWRVRTQLERRIFI